MKKIIKSLLKIIIIGSLVICGGIVFVALNFKTIAPVVIEYLLQPSHFSVSGDRDGNYIVDTEYALTLEKEGQAIFDDWPYIYSYGRSGYICLNQESKIITVFFDENTKDSNKATWAWYAERYYKENLIIVTDITDLTQIQRKQYLILKNKHMKYPLIY